MDSRDILLPLLLLVLVVTRARHLGSTFCRVQRPMLHVALGQGKDPAEMRLVTGAKDTRVMLLAGAGAGNMPQPAPRPRVILYRSAYVFTHVQCTCKWSLSASLKLLTHSAPCSPTSFPRNSFVSRSVDPKRPARSDTKFPDLPPFMTIITTDTPTTHRHSHAEGYRPPFSMSLLLAFSSCLCLCRLKQRNVYG